MEDWKKYDGDFVQTHDILPWGCTCYELLRRMNYLRNKGIIHPKEVDDLQMKERKIMNQQKINRMLTPSLGKRILKYHLSSSQNC